ncbi:hypothetical protein H8R18_08845 [Nanchangia anserum]|uniref:hypothetical protein n=1 Tax=Nanchangia anserum TaxID=2692125 RepID=UPI001883559A|nr:hypothetical protein [Nanchangia anserum]QOX81798.1 hypothetical protein H8R18_08845 [Nanchangia anserum]
MSALSRWYSTARRLCSTLLLASLRVEMDHQWQRARWHRERKRTRARGVAQWLPPAWGVATSMLLATRARVMSASPLANPRRIDALDHRSRARMSEAMEEMQRAYFAYPWLGAATIGMSGRVGSLLARLARTSLRLAVWSRRGDRERHLDRLSRIPEDGYEAFMAAWLALAEAAGVIRAGDIHVREVNWERTDPPVPRLTRTGVPHSLADALEDIDDLTFAATYGSLVKIVRVGDVDQAWLRPLRHVYTRVRGRRQRWIVEIPGTDHLSMATTTNRQIRRPTCSKPSGRHPTNASGFTARSSRPWREPGLRRRRNSLAKTSS